MSKIRHPIQNQEIVKFLEGIEGIVEANSYEHQHLWETYHQRYTWVSEAGGFGYCVNTRKKPTWLSLRVCVVNGKRILSYYATSMRVDYDDVEKWLTLQFPGVKKTDASNFSNLF